jgi:predicted Zn-dependent protease
MSPRYCVYCAAAAESDWIFCQGCGKRLPGTTAGPNDERDRRVAGLWRQALHEMETNDLDLAEKTATALMDLGCDAGDLAALRGSIALRQARLDDAKELFDKAVEESPLSPFVRLKRADYWLSIGISSRAIDELNEGLRHAESEPSRDELRKVLEKLKKDSRWNFSRASPWRR